MATGSLYGSVSESTGLYGIGAASGGTYFEWFIFQDSLTAPATPTGGSWSFSTNIGTPPTGWVVSPPPAPVNQVWVSIAVVDTRSPNVFTWSVPGLMASSGLPILSASGVPSAGTGSNGQLYINTATTPQGLYFKQSGAWTQLTGSNFVDLINNQTIGGVKTFSQTIQGSISGTAANVTGTVAVANGGTGATTAGDARTNLGLGTIATQDASAVAITGGTITGITDLAIADGGTGASTAAQARVNLDAVGLSDTQTLTNKTINAADNTLSNIPNSALSNSSVTINGTPVTLGTAIAVTAETPNELIFSTGLSATSNFDGSQETTVSLESVGTAGVYGSDGTTPQITVNTVGQVTDIIPLDIVITTNNVSGSIAIAQGGTGASAAKFAMQNLLPDYANNAGKALVIATNGTELEWKSTVGVGTVTSIDGSGGSTGLTLTGGPITAAGTLTLGGTLAVDSGGTGAVNAADARTNLGLGSSAVLDAGVALGVATLDGGGTVPTSQLPAAVLGAVKYQGTWNASTNTPTLASSVGSQGHYYVVNVSGSTDLNGITDWLIGDWAIYNGSIWEKIDNTDAVTSVNGYTGTVVLTNTDISGFGTMSTQNANAVAITGGSINGTTIGATTPSTVTGTTVTATTLVVNDNSTLGSSNSDTVNFNARVNSDIDPSTNNAYDLGRNAHAWRSLYLTGTANIAALSASGTVSLSGLTASTALALNASKQVVSVANTGTGDNVLANSPTLVTPALGTPSSATLTNATGLPLTTGVTGILPVANGGTGTDTPALVAGTNVSITGSWPNQTINSTAGGGDVVGPASATDNALARFDTTTGELIQNSVAILDDSGNLSGIADLTASGNVTLSGGTANGVAFLNGSKVLTTGSALTFDGTNFASTGSLTGSTLKSTRASGAQPEVVLTQTGVASWAIYNPPSSTNLRFNNGNDLMTLDASGNLGLGVTPSAWGSGRRALQIAGSTANYFMGANANATVFGTNAFHDGSDNKYISNGFANLYLQSSGQHQWYTAPSGTAGNAISFTQAMTLDASGRLGVNVTDPNAPLDIKSNASANAITIRARAGNDFSFLVFRQADGTEDLGGIANQRTAANTGNLLFYTAGGSAAAERARIDSSGNFLWQKTSVSSVTNGINFENDGANTARLSIGGANSSTATGLSLYSTTAGVFRFFVSYAGQINATSTSITAISDQSLKENIRDLDTGLSEVMALKPRRFDWKEETQLPDRNVAGFIAQEVEQVLPELVYDFQYSADTTKKSLKMGDILPTLVKAIQEQQTLIQTLTARVAALESN